MAELIKPDTVTNYIKSTTESLVLESKAMNE